MDADALRQWLATLDSISYYQLFNVTPEATFDDLRNGFHAFAESFHPDGHQWRHDAVDSFSAFFANSPRSVP